MCVAFCPSVRHWIISHILESNRVRNLKLYHNLRKVMSNGHGIIAVTGRAHCQCQVAFFLSSLPDVDSGIAII